MKATPTVHVDEATEMLTKINHKIEKLFLAQQVEPLIDLYHEDAVVFAEYKPAMTEPTTINHFYITWLGTVNIGAFQKTIYEVQVFSRYLLELGTFDCSYSNTTNHPAQTIYRGKYIVFWQQDNQRQWRIVAEIFGSDTYLTAENVPYADVTVPEPKMPATLNVAPTLWTTVNRLNNQVTRDVGLSNTFIGIASMAAPMLGAVLVSVGYVWIFTASTITSLAALLLLLLRVRDPRFVG